MLSVKTLSNICTDAAQVFEASTNGASHEEVLTSAAFVHIKEEILAEYPDLDDATILNIVLRQYSDKLRVA